MSNDVRRRGCSSQKLVTWGAAATQYAQDTVLGDVVSMVEGARRGTRRIGAGNYGGVVGNRRYAAAGWLLGLAWEAVRE